MPTKATVAGADVILFRQDGDLFALANRCSHRGGPLDKGTVGEGPTVTCPWHFSTFDIADGSVVRGPASAPQPVYEVREREGKIEVRAKS
jgi:nitrite reductase/ring-hydroxylating ferredoxin subunit